MAGTKDETDTSRISSSSSAPRNSARSVNKRSAMKLMNDAFGTCAKANEFHFKDGHTYVNHGAYGAVPRVVQQERFKLLEEVETAPDGWYRWETSKKWQTSLQCVADFLGSDLTNLTFTANVTTGCNAVVKSLRFEPGESILVYTHTYISVKNACRAAMEKCGGNVVELHLPLAIQSKQAIIELYRDSLRNNPQIRLVLLDWISGPATIKFPIEELIALCREYDKLVMVDGAHAPGQVPIHLEKLQADFFIGNLHKWLFTPRGCGVLWVHPDFHKVIKPVVTANNYKSPTFDGDFFTQGTVDHTPFFCAQKALQFFEGKGGIEKINEYCCRLVGEAAEMLARAWGTEKLPISDELCAPHMRLVRVPDMYDGRYRQTTASLDMSNLNHMPSLVHLLATKYQISVSGPPLEGKNWIRLSASVYNCMNDYEQLRDAILDIKTVS